MCWSGFCEAALRLQRTEFTDAIVMIAAAMNSIVLNSSLSDPRSGSGMAMIGYDITVLVIQVPQPMFKMNVFSVT